MGKLIEVLAKFHPKLLSSGQIQMECPFRENHPDGKGSDSMFLTPDKGLYHCFSCNKGGLITNLLTAKLDVPYFEAVEMVSFADTKELPTKNFDLDLMIDSKLPESFLKRGFTKQTLSHFRFGTSDDWTIIPFYRDFNHPTDLIGYQKRKDNPKRIVINSVGFDKKHYLYNYDTTQDYVVLVEGYSDCMRLYQFGCNATALLGATLSDEQVEMLSKFKTVYLALDNDETGRKATEVAYLKLRNVVEEIKLVPYQTKDPGECLSRREWNHYFNSSTDYMTYSLDMYENWEGYLDMREQAIKSLRNSDHFSL